MSVEVVKEGSWGLTGFRLTPGSYGGARTVPQRAEAACCMCKAVRAMRECPTHVAIRLRYEWGHPVISLVDHQVAGGVLA